MKKIIVLTISVCALLMVSCNSSDTYADKLKKERNAIKRLQDELNLRFRNDYPNNGVFQSNEFYLDPASGVYFNVVDSGTGNRIRKATSGVSGSKVFVRYKDVITLVKRDTVAEGNMGGSSGNDLIEFTYGIATTYTGSSYVDGSRSSNYLFKSQGMVAPLEYVGDSAIVRLIVPFSVGSAVQQLSYEPIYFGYVQYCAERGQGE